ncbi:hypothetical protein [Microbacterium sediminicola]
MTRHGAHPRQSRADTKWHFAPLRDDEIVVRDGMRVTCLDRTVYDVIRTESLEAAVACFDAALRLVAWDADANEYDYPAAEEFRAQVRHRVLSHAGARGIIQARFVTAFADGRAQLPGESVSRLWMMQLDLMPPHLQYRIELGDGRYAMLDFAWPELGLWGEFDGEVKYSDARIVGERDRDGILADQRERENRIREVTGWQCHRWGFEKMQTFDAFVAFLRSIRVYPALRRAER